MCNASRTQPHVSHFFKAFGYAFLSHLLACSLVQKCLVFLYSHVREECTASMVHKCKCPDKP